MSARQSRPAFRHPQSPQGLGSLSRHPDEGPGLVEVSDTRLRHANEATVLHGRDAGNLRRSATTKLRHQWAGRFVLRSTNRIVGCEDESEIKDSPNKEPSVR